MNTDEHSLRSTTQICVHPRSPAVSISLFTSVTTEQPVVPTRCAVRFRRPDRRSPAQGEHVPAGAVLQRELAVVAADALAAADALIGVEQDLDGRAVGLPGDDVPAAAPFAHRCFLPRFERNAVLLHDL